jgi:hypothetical protein
LSCQDKKTTSYLRIDTGVIIIDMMDGFSPIETVEHALKRWWLVALLVICGGGIGWLVHKAQPPLYEAKVVFSAAVDFKQSGSINTLEQDKSIRVLGDTIMSDPEIDLVIADAQAAGIKVDRVSLRGMAFLERKSEIWELRIRNSNPAEAQALANLWADRANAEFITYHLHAQQADALRQQLLVLSICLQQAYLPGNSNSLCNQTNPADISTQYQKVSDALNVERLASGGLPSWVLFDLQQKADLPTQPVSYGANTLVLAGCFIGFILAWWVVAGNLLDRLEALISRREPVQPPTREPHL